MKTPAPNITLSTPARLHFGFLGMGGKTQGGARFASFGMAISGCGVILHARRSRKLSAHGDQGDIAAAFARKFIPHYGINGAVAMHVQRAIPQHCGLGSGTQMALAVAAAISALYRIAPPPPPLEMANVLGRGKRSGVGIGAFCRGGVLVDGGSHDRAAPVTIARHQWPRAWRVVLIFDRSMQGIHGSREASIFRTITPYDPRTSERLCQRLVLDVLPSLARGDFDPFARGVTDMQNIIGDHFAKWQGARYASPRIVEILASVARWGYGGYGQSSWGPTAFVLCPDSDAARRLSARIHAHHDTSALDITIHTGNNRGRTARAFQGAPLAPVETSRYKRRKPTTKAVRQ